MDGELVRRGLARSRRHAAELVAAGRVTRAGTVLTKPSTGVGPEDVVEVAPDPHDPGYASRAAFKLAGVLDALDALDAVAGESSAESGALPRGPVVDGARCLDLGASTGGFTDVLLRRGAREVVAVDVGHDQLVPALRADPRVVVHEALNVRDLSPEHVGVVPDVVVGDLSFISLAMVLPAVAGVVGPGTDLLLLVKPQFEVGRERLGSGGVVRDPALHVEVVAAVARHAALVGLRPLAVVPSPLPGPSGNREYFWWLRAGDPGRADGAAFEDEALEAAAAQAVAWQPGPDGGPPPVVAVARAAAASAELSFEPPAEPPAETSARPSAGAVPPSAPHAAPGATETTDRPLTGGAA
ncbi:TlyA family RNA methyltransferase [Cellulosimicrobium terreum]|uniref:TlyA family RNA methyltransferase n=1 Tax=Cellulosimicrobium funkei TaxID=264251 RepID=A0A4Y8R6Z3_9MICO|nr:TlyA family RNA methyltransferase [Cellulosimicrobium funkei]TGA78791.1 TlyA family RNA methyltransferase [Cellulosimicrobium terreum]